MTDNARASSPHNSFMGRPSVCPVAFLTLAEVYGRNGRGVQRRVIWGAWSHQRLVLVLELRKVPPHHSHVWKVQKGPREISGEAYRFRGTRKTGKSCLEAQPRRGCRSVKADSAVWGHRVHLPEAGAWYRKTLYSFPGQILGHLYPCPQVCTCGKETAHTAFEGSQV